MGWQGVLPPQGPKGKEGVSQHGDKEPTSQAQALHHEVHHPTAAQALGAISSLPSGRKLGTATGGFSLPRGTPRFAGTRTRGERPADTQLGSITGSTQQQPTLFEGSSFNAAFKMGMASLYSPC